MAKAEFHETLKVNSQKLLQAVLEYEKYPEFVEGCSKIEVERKSSEECLVTYHIKIMKDLIYTQRMRELVDAEKKNGKIEWSLQGTNAFFNVSDGGWEIKEAGPNQSDVKYWLDLDFKFPIPGFVLKGLINNRLKANVADFEKRAKSL